MSNLLELIGMIEPEVEPESTIQERSEAFDRANPAVYRELRRLAFILLDRGHKRFGVKMLAEQLRWQWYERTTDISGYKLNNTYVAFYARKLMACEPELAGVFELRASPHSTT
jgi:hypothetical protein